MNVKDLFKDALPILSSAAPTIAGIIGGPAGYALGYVIPFLANSFGANPSDLQAIASKIANDPDAQIKLAELEKTHSQFLNSLSSPLDKLSKASLNISLEFNDFDPRN